MELYIFSDFFYRAPKVENESRKDNRKKKKIPESKIYCPHERLNFKFKETLNFGEQVSLNFLLKCLFFGK
jgi:hypothetical protein